MSKNSTFGLSIVTDRYAAAFISLAEQIDMLDKFDTDLALIKETFIENKDLKDFLEHPLIQLNDKKEVIDSIFRKHVSVYTLNLLKVLIEKNRIFILPLLADHYREILNKKRNIVTANIITAVEIDDEVKNRVKDKLQNLLNSTINIKSETDKNIIAGMVVKIGDKILDGSLKTKLETMKKQLI